MALSERNEAREKKHIRIQNRMIDLSEVITNLEEFVNSLNASDKSEVKQPPSLPDAIGGYSSFVDVYNNVPDAIGRMVERLAKVRAELQEILV